MLYKLHCHVTINIDHVNYSIRFCVEFFQFKYCTIYIDINLFIYDRYCCNSCQYSSRYTFQQNSTIGIKVGLVDERSEIAACHKGMPQFDVGIRTDVLDGCPKSIGMIMMIRSMSPQVIITDEIGDQGDKDSIITILNAGIKIITTAHGFNISELKSRTKKHIKKAM
jgi:hypothetical protein